MKKILSEISLRSLTAVMVGVLVLIALAYAVGEYRDSRAELRNAQLMVERNALADVCLKTVDSLFTERGRSLAYLFAGRPISGEHRAILDERRRIGDEHMARTLALAADKGHPQAGAARQEWERIRALRPALDQSLSVAQEHRDPSVSQRWMATANELVVRLLGLMHEMVEYPEIEDAGFEQISQLRLSTLLFRTMIGAESGVFGVNFLSGRTVAAREITSLRLMRTQSMIVWDRLEQGLNRIGDARTRGLVEKTRQSLSDELRRKQEEILLAAERGVLVANDDAYLRDYAGLALRVLDTVSELGEDTGRLADGYTHGRLAKARAQERMALVGIGLILLLGALTFFVFVARVGRPLQAIQKRVDGLLKRHSGSLPEGRTASGGDECGRINAALQLLEETMEARNRSDRNLREQERISASILSTIPQSVIVTDEQGIITLFSPGAETMLGYSAGEVIGRETPMLFHDPEEVRKRARELTEELGIPVVGAFPAFIAKAQATGQPDEREWTYIRKDGSRLTVLLSVTVFNDDQGNLRCCGVATDITERSQVAAEVSRQANCDPLTQLPNRRLFHDRIRMAISQARRENTFLALLMIDLDRFKPVNDEFGHSVGDLLLVAVAGRMQKCLRESDTLARVGGDEFVVILPMIGGVADAARVAEKMRLSLCSPFELTDDITVSIDCSIGIAVYPEHGGSEDLLLKSADNAMYVAKALGRAQVHVSGGTREDGMIRAAPDNCGVPVANLVWRRSYQCGDATIDREHKELFMHGNTLIRAVANGRIPLEKLPEMLDELIESVMAHFRNEEFILARYGYADLEGHAGKHRKLIERALELRSMAVSGELSLSDVASFVTRDVVAVHMLIDDHEYFPLLRKASQRNPLELP